MNTTAPHPQPAYWFTQGRAAGQAGDFGGLDPEDYGRVFADDHPPQEWIDAYVLGRIQGCHDLMDNRVESEKVKAEEFCAAVAKFPLHVILVAWVAGKLNRFAQ